MSRYIFAQDTKRYSKTAPTLEIDLRAKLQARLRGFTDRLWAQEIK